MGSVPRTAIAAVVVAVLLVSTACNSIGGSGSTSGAPQDIEVFTWWVAGGEQQGLNGLVRSFNNDCASYSFVNGAVAGGGGANAKQVLATRLQQGDPPDTFQAHAGAELADYIEAGQIQDLSERYQQWGLSDAFPKGLLKDLSFDGKIYSVPANIHRANVVWSNKAVLEGAGIRQEPTTIDEFIADLDVLRARGISTPLAMGKDWTQLMTFEAVLISVLGPEKFSGLWKDATNWSDAGVTRAIETYKKLLSYTNADRDKLDWTDAEELVVEGRAAFQLMGDWEAADLATKGYTGYGHFVFPGNGAVFQWLADSFVLPKGAKHAAGTECWLKTVGSRNGQRAFNIAKGSIPARSDANPSDYSRYQQTAIEEWKTATQAPSCAHGSACPLGLQTAAASAVASFGVDADVAGLQKAMSAAATQYIK